MENVHVISVTQLNNDLKKFIEDQNNFKRVTVQGEIDNITYNKSGHVYFTLRDAQGSSINCIVWKTNAAQLINIEAKSGMKIVATGRVTYYVPSGRVSFDIVKVELDGVGELEIIYQKRYKELEHRGWFDKLNKKPLPQFPKNIGIITSQTGAAVQDLIQTMARRYSLANIYLFPAQVQGEKAAKDVANKIKQANNFNIDLDILIVGRGGGSYEDLWVFNEMEILEAIKDSSIPIISAVGHEPDYTLSDYVADIRAATPTAAGELATPDIKEIKRNLLESLNLFKNRLENKFISNSNLIKDSKLILKNSIKLKYKYKLNLLDNIKLKFNNVQLKKENAFKILLSKKRNELENILENKIKMIDINIKNNYLKFKNSIDYKLNFYTNLIYKINMQNEIKNPTLPLQNGFALIKNDSNKIIKNKKDISSKKIKIYFNDGNVKANIEE